MENYTSVPTEFHILPFSDEADRSPLVFGMFAVFYSLGILMNVLIITLIYLDQQLHSPMYLFLCNLSLVDMCYTTTVIPKLLHILSSGNHKMSFPQCFTQMFFFFLAAGTEDLLLFAMAYDRYVAICKPLHYHTILSKKVCFICMAAIWLCAAVNSCLITVPTSQMSFCHFITIHHIYCDAKALTKISCAGKEIFYSVIYFELLFFGLCPFLCSVTSYAKILQVIFRIKSRDGRTKAFSTCSSHLIVILLYYGTAASVYLLPKTKYSHILDQIFTLLYATGTPTLNPLIYSLRNKDVKRAVMRLLPLKRWSTFRNAIH
ncbi:olfactory receptor-like protein DTMT [Anomaloglossus baeobatrachus]|uniref:olfactory receptor-like protein DTMT n=1 Tax=Anomaloglossus baeobatrachus TaxID=238106 RepID=UPI003F4FAB23